MSLSEEIEKDVEMDLFGAKESRDRRTWKLSAFVTAGHRSGMLDDEPTVSHSLLCVSKHFYIGLYLKMLLCDVNFVIMHHADKCAWPRFIISHSLRICPFLCPATRPSHRDMFIVLCTLPSYLSVVTHVSSLSLRITFWQLRICRAVQQDTL